MGFKAVALNDLRQHWGCLFRAVSIQLYSVAPGAGIPGNGGESYAFSNAWVQRGRRLGGKLQQVSNSLRFSKRQRVIVAANSCGEARHTKLLKSANWGVTGLIMLPLWQYYESQIKLLYNY
jgi:hypothetical protein